MTKKSYITLCVVGIVYIIMATTAILSPHGNSFSSASTPTYDANGIVPGMNDQFEDIDESIIITNSSGIEVEIELVKMPALVAIMIEYAEDDTPTTFTAARMSSVVNFSTLKVGNEVILTDNSGETYSIDAESFSATDNAYLVFGDADKNPLSNEYGYFCVIIMDGESAGIYRDIAKINLG